MRPIEVHLMWANDADVRARTQAEIAKLRREFTRGLITLPEYYTELWYARMRGRIAAYERANA